MSVSRFEKDCLPAPLALPARAHLSWRVVPGSVHRTHDLLSKSGASVREEHYSSQ